MSSANKRHIDNHIKIAEAIYHMFKQKEKAVLRWGDILESLKESNQNTFTEDKEYKSLLVTLSKIVPDWISLITMP